MPISRAKEERMWRLAYQMARSGKYSGWLSIEHELRSRGYSRARHLLDRESIRERLDKMCTEAREGCANA